MVDYIDTSVFISALGEERKECRKYLQTLGYKQHGKGVVSHFVLSEIMVKVITDVFHFNREIEAALREQALVAFQERIHDLWRSERLKMLKLEEKKIDCDLLKELQAANRNLTYDDALHLGLAIQVGCDEFVTTDKLFVDEMFCSYLKKEHDLRTRVI